MTYADCLHCWIVVLLLPNLQSIVIGRFYCRTDAEGYCALFQLHNPHHKYAVMFDVEQPKNAAEVDRPSSIEVEEV